MSYTLVVIKIPFENHAVILNFSEFIIFGAVNRSFWICDCSVLNIKSFFTVLLPSPPMVIEWTVMVKDGNSNSSNFIAISSQS
jgi:hypothetical protein